MAREALLLHGFTGTPGDLESLRTPLCERGFRVEAPTLPGHDATPADLGRTRWPDWQRACEAALEGMSGPVAVAGLSMGALLAIRLAALFPERIHALALISTPLRFGPAVRAVAWLGWLLPYLPKRGVDVSDPAERSQPGYPVWPLRAAHSVIDLARQARTVAPRVRAPSLILHARHDHVAPLAGADDVARLLGGPITRVTLERSFHLIPRDVERVHAARVVCDFFEEHLP